MSSAPITTDQFSAKNHQRRSPRQRIETLMYVDLGPENGGFPINVSEGGMAFQGIQPLEKDQLVHINFKLPGITNSVESAAQIAWLNDLGKGGGLRFIDLPDCTRRQINEWLSQKTSSCGLTEDSPILITVVETEIFPSAPDIHFVTDQDHSSAKNDSSAAETLLDSSPSPVAARDAIKTSGTAPLPIPSADSARNSGFRHPSLKTNRRKSWSTPVLLGLVSCLAIVAILGVISFQFHWSLQLPTFGGNPVQPGNESVAATAPQFSSEIQTADPPPTDPADLGPASPADRSAIDPIAPSEEPAPLGKKAPVSRPAKIAVPKKVNPPRTLSQKIGTNPKQVRPRLKLMSPAGDVTPPQLGLPTNSPMASQLPALLLEMHPPAAAPREPVQQTGKFDAAQLIARKNPVYPKLAQAIGLSGSVELHFIIGADGYVHDVIVVKGNPLLARAAVEAIQTWRYQPARRDGVPVETDSSTIFAFKPN